MIDTELIFCGKNATSAELKLKENTTKFWIWVENWGSGYFGMILLFKF